LGAVLDVAAGAGDAERGRVAEHGGGFGAPRAEVVEGEHEHGLPHEGAVPAAVDLEREPGAGGDGAPFGEALGGDVLATDQPAARPEATRQGTAIDIDHAEMPSTAAPRLATADL